jgi:hypothetical protein
VRALLLGFLLFAAAASPAPGHERDILRRRLLDAGIPFREDLNVAGEAGSGGAGEDPGSAWIWVESRSGTEDDDGSFVQSPELLPSNAPVLAVGLDPEREGLGPGAEIALALAGRMAGGEAPLSLVFYDALDNRGLPVFAEALEDPEDTRLLILDAGDQTESPGPDFTIYHGSRRALAPLSMVKLLTELLEEARRTYRFGNRFNELYKLGVSPGPPELEITGTYGIPAILLRGSGGEPLMETLADFFGRVRIEQGNVDLHYSIYRIQGRTLFVSEQGAVLFIILANGLFFAALLLSFLTRRTRMLFLLRTSLSHIWVSLLYFLGLFLSMALANAIFAVLTGIFRPAPPAGNPAWWFLVETGLRAAAGIGIFFLLPGSLLSVIPLVKRGGFYGFTAMLSSTLFLYLGIYLDITTAHFFIWMLGFVSLSMIWDRPVLPFLFTLFTLLRPGFVLQAAAETGGELPGGAGLIGAFASAVILFPPALSFMRSVVLTIRQRSRRQRTTRPLKIIFVILCLVVTALWALRYRTV